MEVMKIIVIGCAATVFALLIKNQRPEIALILSIATGVVLLLFAINSLGEVITWIDGLSRQYGLDMGYVGVAVKITGMACLCDWGASLCRDAGESSIALKVELGGKVLILLLSLPVIEELLSMVASLLS